MCVCINPKLLYSIDYHQYRSISIAMRIIDYQTNELKCPLKLTEIKALYGFLVYLMK